MSNFEWNKEYPNVQCIHGLAIGSDHVPILVRLEQPERRGRNAFKFKEIWLQHPECSDIIQTAWEKEDL